MTLPLFTLDAVLKATGGHAVGVDAAAINSISIDSRELGPDALFVAIKGDRFDGHDFADTALANGAVAALVSDGQSVGEGRVVVADALGGLRDLARAARLRSRAFIVGVTGSVGKTTTKEAIRTVLESAGETHYSIKSFNNHWGVPLMLARMPETAQFGVFEMGMSAQNEIRPLSQLVRPHVAVITNVAAAHLENLGTLENIALAKAEIFDGLEPGGTAVLFADHPQIDILLKAASEAGVARVVTYGFGPGVDWQISAEELGADGATAKVSNGSEEFALKLNVPGRHMLINATAALIVADLAGLDLSFTLKVIERLGAQPGRGQRTVFGGADKPLLLIDESYNANTASMSAALAVYASVQPKFGRKHVVLGDMLELGEQSLVLHAGLAEAVVASGAERVHLVGGSMRALADVLPSAILAGHHETVEQAIDVIIDDLAYGDTIMIKGSNGVGLARLVSAITKSFSNS